MYVRWTSSTRELGLRWISPPSAVVVGSGILHSSYIWRSLSWFVLTVKLPPRNSNVGMVFFTTVSLLCAFCYWIIYNNSCAVPVSMSLWENNNCFRVLRPHLDLNWLINRRRKGARRKNMSDAKLRSNCTQFHSTLSVFQAN